MTLCRTRSLEKHPDIAPVRLPSSTPLHICLAARYPNFMGAVTPQSPTEQRGPGAGAAGLVSVLEEPGEAQQDGVRCTACSPPLVATPKSIAKRAFEIENWAPSTQLEIVQLQRVSAAESTSGISFYARATNAFPITKLNSLLGRLFKHILSRSAVTSCCGTQDTKAFFILPSQESFPSNSNTP